MKGEIDEIEYNDYLDDDGQCICPFTKSRCPTPWLMGDCWNDCARPHKYEDW